MRYILKSLGLFLVVLFLFSAWGCRVRTYTVEKPRVDLEVSGNQGYLSGQPDYSSGTAESRVSSTRTINVLEFDIGPKSKPEGDSERKYNKQETGDIVSEYDSIKEAARESVKDDHSDSLYEQDIIQTEDFQVYVVEKNDTLQKISFKFYGTTKKWIDIHQANTDVLPTPDKIRPGQRLKIPVE
jgi:nucleoid-associated protein YgaU